MENTSGGRFQGGSAARDRSLELGCFSSYLDMGHREQHVHSAVDVHPFCEHRYVVCSRGQRQLVGVAEQALG